MSINSKKQSARVVFQRKCFKASAATDFGFDLYNFFFLPVAMNNINILPNWTGLLSFGIYDWDDGCHLNLPYLLQAGLSTNSNGL